MPNQHPRPRPTTDLVDTRPDLKRGFRVPLVPVIPILAAISCLWLMLNLEVETWLRFVIWMVIGMTIYFAYGRSHSMQARATGGATGR